MGRDFGNDAQGGGLKEQARDIGCGGAAIIAGLYCTLSLPALPFLLASCCCLPQAAPPPHPDQTPCRLFLPPSVLLILTHHMCSSSSYSCGDHLLQPPPKPHPLPL